MVDLILNRPLQIFSSKSPHYVRKLLFEICGNVDLELGIWLSVLAHVQNVDSVEMRGLPSDVLCIFSLSCGLQEGTLFNNRLAHRKFLTIDTKVLATSRSDSEAMVDDGFWS